MSAKAISEATGKSLLVKHLSTASDVFVKPKYVTINEQTDLDRLSQEHPWLTSEASIHLDLDYTCTVANSLSFPPLPVAIDFVLANCLCKLGSLAEDLTVKGRQGSLMI